MSGLSVKPEPVKPPRERPERRRDQYGSAPGGEERRSNSDRRTENNDELVTFTVGGQLLGIPVARVQEVLPPQRVTRVPHAPAAVMGLLNLRGQIVTAVDLRSRLGIPAREAGADHMNVIVEEGGELYSVMVDSVGEVLPVAKSRLTAAPSTLDDVWKQACEGVYRLNEGLLVILNVSRMLQFKKDHTNKGESS